MESLVAFSELLSINRCLTEWADRIILKPLTDAISVENMFDVARKRRDILLIFELTQADRTVCNHQIRHPLFVV